MQRMYLPGLVIMLWGALVIMMNGGVLVKSTAGNVLIWSPYLQQVTDASAIILWTTEDGGVPTARYAPNASYDMTAVGTSTPLSELGTHLHRVVLTQLEPNTTYFYKVYLDNEELIPGGQLSFRTNPMPGAKTPFTFLAFGDFGTDLDGQERLRDRMKQDTFSFIVTTGDNAYQDGRYEDFAEKVFEEYPEIFGKGPIYPSLGNHEYHTDDGAPYLDVFDLPRQAWRAHEEERYYSFDYGNTHFVVLDSNAPLDVDDHASNNDMFDWLRHDLSNTKQPWKIAVLHHSPYSTGDHGSDERARAKLVPIFEQFEINLVLSGHDHTYQRTQPLKQGRVTTVEDGGIVYVVTGAGSGANYACSPAEWLEVRYCAEDFGVYNRIAVNGDTLTLEAVDDEGQIRDLYVMTQPSERSLIPLFNNLTLLAFIGVVAVVVVIVIAGLFWQRKLRRTS